MSHPPPCQSGLKTARALSSPDSPTPGSTAPGRLSVGAPLARAPSSQHSLLPCRLVPLGFSPPLAPTLLSFPCTVQSSLRSGPRSFFGPLHSTERHLMQAPVPLLFQSSPLIRLDSMQAPLGPRLFHSPSYQGEALGGTYRVTLASRIGKSSGMRGRGGAREQPPPLRLTPCRAWPRSGAHPSGAEGTPLWCRGHTHLYTPLWCRGCGAEGAHPL